MTEEKDIQCSFLTHIHKQRMSVTVFLMNGVKLQGVVDHFDSQSILLERSGHKQLIYKHAISTIMPTENIPNLTDITAAADKEIA